MERLQASLSIHKRPGGLCEWCDGQNHIADVHVGLEWTERHDHLSPRNRFLRFITVSDILFGLGVEENHCFQARVHHFTGIAGGISWNQAQQLSADGVGGFSEIPNGRSSVLADPTSQAQQAFCLFMMCGTIAQQNSLVRTGHQRMRNLSRSIIVLDVDQRNDAQGVSNRFANFSQALHPEGGRQHAIRRQRQCPIRP